MLEAVQKAALEGFSFGAPTEREVELAEEIIRHVPSMEMIRLVSSGTEAGMSAIRLARGATGAARSSNSTAATTATPIHCLVKAGSGLATFGHATSAGVPPEVVQHTLVLEYNDVAQLEEAFALHGKEVACVIMEPIAGNMNFVRAHRLFMRRARELCTQNGALLVIDEVMTGFAWPGQCAGPVCAQLHPVSNLTSRFWASSVIAGGRPAAWRRFMERPRAIMEQLAPLGPVYQGGGTQSGNRGRSSTTCSTGLRSGDAARDRPGARFYGGNWPRARVRHRRLAAAGGRRRHSGRAACRFAPTARGSACSSSPQNRLQNYPEVVLRRPTAPNSTSCSTACWRGPSTSPGAVRGFVGAAHSAAGHREDTVGWRARCSRKL